jgi:plasmid stability protein
MKYQHPEPETLGLNEVLLHNGSIMEPRKGRSMATLTVKNIPDDLLDLLRGAAAAHRRSLNSEVLVYLERALAPRVRSADELLARARDLRQRVQHAPLSLEALDAARKEGRP